MVNAKSLANRSVAVISALALSLATILPLVTGSAGAAQVASRSIQMSQSQPSATGVTYSVSFTAPTGSQDIGGVVVDFCSDSPIVGVACNGVDGTSRPNLASAGVSGLTGLTGFTESADPDNDGNTIIITNATPENIADNTDIDFNITAAVNPSNTGTFYARILTFSTEAAANAYNPTATTGFVDQGGIALSTAAVITITALVQESLNFAVTGTSVTMGTGTPQIIDDTQQWISSAVNLDLDTNATSGLNIRLYGTHLVSGSNNLSGNNVENLTSGGVLTGAANNQFGICTKNSTNAQVLADDWYETAQANCTTAGTSTFTWDNTSASATGGDTVFTSAGPVDNDVNSNVDIYYSARADANVPAGQYQATHQLIATGTF